MKIKNEIVAFSSLDIPYRYDADEGIDLKDDIYVPLLSNSISHERFTYGFSAKVLTTLISGIEGLILNKGKMKLIIGQTLDDKTDDAIQEGLDDLEKGYQAYCLRELDQLINQKRDHKQDYQLGLLSNLIGSGTLEIKFAFKLEAKIRPYQHSKIAIFKGEDSEIVCWEGSGNLSDNALFEHYETFSIFKSYTPKDGFPIQGPLIQNQFKKMWTGGKENWDVVTVPDEFYKRWKKAFKEPSEKDIYDALAAMKARISKKKKNFGSSKPKKPVKELVASINELENGRPHQIKALDSWESNNRSGILKHATGSGKTFTALFALKRHLVEKQIGLIIVPDVLLQTQWKEEIKKIIPEAKDENLLLAGGEGKKNFWYKNLKRFTAVRNKENIKIVIAVAETASSSEFITSITQGENLMIIADEVHSLGTEERSSIFNINCSARIGLSATPERFGDIDGTKRIFDYFGETLKPDFSLSDAIKQKRLVPYKYFPELCILDDEELENYEDLSKRIKQIYARSKEKKDIPYLKSIIFERARISKDAKSKVNKAINIIEREYIKGQKWLVYCQDIIQLEKIFEGLNKKNINSSKYFSELKKNKGNDLTATLNAFESIGGILLSIKCLDQGVDIPSVTHALIIASDQNPRQFIQRRGRVLRPDPENHKEKAFIYDLIVADPTSRSDSIKNLTKIELKRAKEFSQTSSNKKICESKLRNYAINCNINFDDLTTSLEDMDNLEFEEERGL
tara:strand:+ start:472 stop:2685 length:2214 start_codon:yes stop_codon:yes gene_type:complete